MLKLKNPSPGITSRVKSQDSGASVCVYLVCSDFRHLRSCHKPRKCHRSHNWHQSTRSKEKVLSHEQFIAAQRNSTNDFNIQHQQKLSKTHIHRSIMIQRHTQRITKKRNLCRAFSIFRPAHPKCTRVLRKSVNARSCEFCNECFMYFHVL